MVKKKDCGLQLGLHPPDLGDRFADVLGAVFIAVEARCEGIDDHQRGRDIRTLNLRDQRADVIRMAKGYGFENKGSLLDHAFVRLSPRLYPLASSARTLTDDTDHG